MKWKKLGIVYGPDGSSEWAKSHAMIPTPLRISDKVIRVFVTFCDANGIGRPGYVDVEAKNPKNVIRVSREPLMDIGQPGTFDENGVLPCSVIDVDGKLYMYYVGFELGTKIRYRLLTGLAVSEDGGESFVRIKQTPVLERSDEELYFRCGPYVLYEKGRYRLWYVGGSNWTVINEKEMPIYDIRYLESEDGINWGEEGKVVLSISEPDEHGFGRPFVIRESGGEYIMHYSIRRISYSAYRLGIAKSRDGINWIREDNKLCLDVSRNGYDSSAIMYSAPIRINNETFIFYNGNNYGKEGFAAAKLISK